jgi:hypothetical protein
MSIEATGETTPRISSNSTENGAQLQVFLTGAAVSAVAAVILGVAATAGQENRAP